MNCKVLLQKLLFNRFVSYKLPISEAWLKGLSFTKEGCIMHQRKLSLIPAIFPVLIVNVATFGITSNPLQTTDFSYFAATGRGSEIEVAQYKPPKDLGTPPTVGGGTRGGRCEADQDENRTDPFLMALMPNLKSEPKHFGTTVSEAPEFLVYIPQTVARQAEFVLKDEEDNDIYRTTFDISGNEAIASLTLPSDEIKLESGINYSWYFSLICNPQDFRKNVETQGWTQRVELNPNLITTLEAADPITRSQLYAENGVWHEAIAILAQLRQEQPTDPLLAQTWQNLLESANLGEIATLPNEVPIIAISLENTSTEIGSNP